MNTHRKIIMALAAGVLITITGVAAVLLSVRAADGHHNGTVKSCTTAIVAAWGNNTLSPDSPIPGECWGLTLGQLAQAVTDALSSIQGAT